MNKIKYIDLFAGIGGFHQAMNTFNSECIFASEIDKHAINTYGKNYGISSDLDVTTIDSEYLKDKVIDLLCGGFPCQAFSKAGNQAGFDDETKGTLFFDIERILKIKKNQGQPIKYILLENVANLVTHDNGNTYSVISKHLRELGYSITETPILASPHEFGIPQLRNRVFIAGIYRGVKNPEFLTLDISMFNKKKNESDCYSILETGLVDDKYNITEYENEVLTAWDEFYKGINIDIIGFPIWLEHLKDEECSSYPKWKQSIIKRNNILYKENRMFIDKWLQKYNPIEKFTKTHCKFEWQAGNDIDTLWEGIIQFRPSGVRVKRPTEFPALVAMVQIPIIGKYKRRLTVREVARLQSFPDDFIPDDLDQQAYKQFGNSVNVKVIHAILEKLLYHDKLM